jgi:hypothetical protein
VVFAKAALSTIAMAAHTAADEKIEPSKMISDAPSVPNRSSKAFSVSSPMEMFSQISGPIR